MASAMALDTVVTDTTTANPSTRTSTDNNDTNMIFTSQQQPSQVLSSQHMDYIHHVAFDVYGRRMATCSGDRFVRVWDLSDTGEWNLAGGEWQAHRGSVTMLAWSHPEFGLLATCGSDHDAKIWEERSSTASITPSSSTTANHHLPTGGMISSGASISSAGTAAPPASRWIIKAQLTEARRAVSCLEFAPRHWGLKLATGSADGCVRIYEAVDVMNLAQWPLAATLQVCGGEGLGVTCLSWCTGRFEPPTLVVGGDGGGSSTLTIYRYSDTARQWQSLLTLPTTAKDVHVLDVAWAKNVGRRFDYIASAEDDRLRIHKLARNANDQYNLELVSTQTLKTNVWRCQWNVTGTVLASSGDAGVVQLWKADFDGNFRCVSHIQGDVGAVSRSAAA